MATIKAIEGRSVHQIQSGQVIVDLYSVVKELVENSLDAGASSIEVRFKNHGLDSIEVSDNGKGISSDDFDTIALKHYTSKLSTYEDLTTLDTFGFRGEALSSLCALSKFHIVTARSEDGALGKKLEFESSGKLKGTSPVAATKGTTVVAENLFSNLPVRRKELEKNIKREYGKVIGHLHAYACISVGVRFAVSNQMPKAKKATVFSTKSNTTTKENITNVFGTKALLALVKLDLQLEMEPSKGPATQTARNWGTQATDRSREVQVQGYISKPVFGEGRQAPDRQMYYVNSRPCGLPQVSKAVNEVYKSFNVTQVPFVFANFIMDTNAYDVNVSPDKRNIMLHDQTALLDSLKAALNQLFEQTDQTMPQTQLPSKKLPNFKPLTVPHEASMGADSPPGADESDAGSESDEGQSLERNTARTPSNNTSFGTPSSLIQNWIGRDAESRSQMSTKRCGQRFSKGKEELAQAVQNRAAGKAETAASDDETPRRSPDHGYGAEEEDSDGGDGQVKGNENTGVTDNTAEPPDSLGSPYDDIFSQRPNHPPKSVQDFNAIMDRKQPNDSLSATKDDSPPADSEREAEPESEIRAIAPSSQKATPGPIQNAFDRMRPKRTPLQTAEITIGDQTTTTVIGSSPPSKRRRVHQPADSRSIADFGGSPILARGLRSFAAPGSQLNTESSEVSPNRAQAAEPSDDEEDIAESKDSDEMEEEDGNAHGGDDHAPLNGGTSSDLPTSDPLDALLPAPTDDDEDDEDYIDEHEKKVQEDEKVARLIQEAESAAAQPTEQNLRRASQALKNGGGRKEATLKLVQYVKTSPDEIQRQRPDGLDSEQSKEKPRSQSEDSGNAIVKDEIDDGNAESRLSLTVSKTDFEQMIIVGQFNLGFVLAVRPSSDDQNEDELFIIDQHAADEKYNYERLQRTVTLQNQRLVRPKPLDLTAIEEEIILSNKDALKANGFEIEISSDMTDDDDSSGRQCRLITLPISGEKTFDLSDLEELLHLISEAPAGSSEIPRPKKVQRMLAMRACRSSIMVGKTLTQKQMEKVVRHMGEMEKPWNCPHGRPTMRHLASLGSWKGWMEGDSVDSDEDPPDASRGGRKTDWKSWLEQHQ